MAATPTWQTGCNERWVGSRAIFRTTPVMPPPPGCGTSARWWVPDQWRASHAADAAHGPWQRMGGRRFLRVLWVCDEGARPLAAAARHRHHAVDQRRGGHPALDDRALRHRDGVPD